MAAEMFVSRNMNYIYYREYFQAVTDLAPQAGAFVRKSEEVTDFIFEHEMENICRLKELYCEQGTPLSRVELKTTYPGLLTGIGISHDVKGQGGINGGFAFDHVTGMPYISGSELKGVLRSYFPSMKSTNKEEYEDFIRALLGAENLDVEGLEQALFEEHVRYIGGFLTGQGKDRILQMEYFTPHRNKLRNPNPVSVLKVKPDVHFEFLFDLNEWEDNQNIRRDEILKLFKDLLVLGGIGAKRNVGFSQFKEV